MLFQRRRFDEAFTFAFATIATLALSSAFAPSALADDEKKLGWFDTAELSFVSTTGNAESETFGFKNQLRRVWAESAFAFDLGGVRSEATTISRQAVSSSGGFRVIEQSNTVLSAENYFARGRYDHNIRENFFAFGSLGWDRNEFAGINNRYELAAGVGNIWFDNETSRFRTDYALTYTSEDRVINDPSKKEDFAGLQLGYDYWRKLTASTEYGSVLLIKGNLDETSDYRADFSNWISVAMSEKLALKLALQLLYDNEPALVGVDLLGPTGSPTGTQVAVPLDDIDSIFTVSLVVNF